MHNRGLDSSIIKWICNGDIALYSPSILLRSLKLSESFPHVALFHGSADASIPYSATLELAAALRNAGELVIFYIPLFETYFRVAQRFCSYL
jgi:hypothetical protein